MAYFRRRNCTCQKKRCSCGSKWEYRIKYLDRQADKWKEKTKSGFNTKKEAQLAAAQEELYIDDYGFTESNHAYIRDYIYEWLEVYKKPNLQPITYSLQERTVRNNILPKWANYKLKDITRSDYQRWINGLPTLYSEGTIRRIHSIFSSAMNDAVYEFNILRANPIQKIKIPKDRSDKSIKYFTKEQLEIFLNEAKNQIKHAKYNHSIQYYALFFLMSRTGIRIGEALALKWEDWQYDQLTIDKTLVYPTNSTPYLSTPKTESSKRTIKLDQATIDVLKQHRLNQKEVVMLYQNYQPSPDHQMFHQHTGRVLRSNIVRDQFKVICKRANLPVLSPHALRHAHAVHLLEAGAKEKYVSERLGHKSVKVTSDTYLHITQKIEDDALDLYSDYLSQ